MKKVDKNIGQNEIGMSVIGIMLLAGALAAAASGIGSLISGRMKAEQQITLQQGAELARQNVVAGIAQERSWRQTFLTEGSMSCLRNDGETCATGSTKTAFSLMLVNGARLAGNPAAFPNQGFDRMGNPCDKFDAANGNDECPLRYVLTWSCNGPCEPTQFIGAADVPAKPKIFIEGRLEFKPKTRGQDNMFKTSLYTFSVVRGEEERDLSATCRSVGGFFDPGKKHCAITKGPTRMYGGVAGIGCDPSTEYLSGLNPDGTPICATKALIGQACPSRNAIVGLTADGDLLCGKF